MKNEGSTERSKLTLTQLRKIACVLEDAEKQAGAIKGKQEVNRVYRKEFKKESNQGRKVEKINAFAVVWKDICQRNRSAKRGAKRVVNAMEKIILNDYVKVNREKRQNQLEILNLDLLDK